MTEKPPSASETPSSNGHSAHPETAPTPSPEASPGSGAEPRSETTGTAVPPPPPPEPASPSEAAPVPGAPPSAATSDPSPSATPPPQEGASGSGDLRSRARTWGGELLDNLRSQVRLNVVLFFLLAPLAVVWMSLKFVILPAAASNALAVWAEGQDMDLRVEDWSSDVLDLSARAEGIVLVSRGPYARAEMLTADSLEVDLSLWSGLFKDQWIREVRMEDPELYLERLAAGRWNWEDVATFELSPGVAEALADPSTSGPGGGTGSLPAGDAADEDGDPPPGSFRLPRLVLDGMSLQWVETLPGSSGGGIIQDVKASLYLDDVHLTLTDVVGLVDLRPDPTGLSIEARTGSGKISFNGKGNLFSWSLGQDAAGEPESGVQLASVSYARPAWSPRLGGTVYLENIEAGVLARLTPHAALVPQRGSISGKVEFSVDQGKLGCTAYLHLQDVIFAANPSSPLLQNTARREAMQQDLSDRVVHGQYAFPCGGVLGTDTFRPFHAFHTKVVQQGTRDAPSSVRAVAAMDHSQYSTDEIDPELHRDVAEISRDLDPTMRDRYNLSADILALMESLQRVGREIRRNTGSWWNRIRNR